MTNDIPRGLFIPILIYHHLTWLISAQSSAPGNAPHLIPQGKQPPCRTFSVPQFTRQPHHQGCRHSLSWQVPVVGTCLGNKMGIKRWLWLGVLMLSWVSVSVPAFSLLGECRSPLLQPLSQTLSYSIPAVAEPSLWGWFLVVQPWQHREKGIMEQELRFPWEGDEWGYPYGSFPSQPGLTHSACCSPAGSLPFLPFLQFLRSSTGPTAPL